MGESPKAEISVYSSEFELFSVETPWGRIHIRWDNEANATPNAQLAFFAEFLATAGLYESWVSSCPLSYSSGIVSHKRDVVGTWFLSILAGHHRYAHITGLRGDGVSPQILGMSKIVSEDSLRRLDVSEGFQLFDTLQMLKVPSKMLYFPDEGHWVLKPQNSRHWYKTVNDWVDQWTNPGH
jgi:hypothetical protein